ncbi:Isoleucyl-tRNA synthetase [uncultured virus]|nr:Isoleucyl-tRNA synthetase [uncultured virus]
MNLDQIPSDFSFPKNEEKISLTWKEQNIYQQQIDKNQNGPIFNFNDGPPFTSGSLHLGHLHISSIKSCILNYMSMNGYNVLNKIGYDVHGLPIEQAISKLLNLKTKQEIENFGINKYNAICKETINKYSKSWNPIFERIGRFVDFDNQYKTMDTNYMETCWWVFKQLWEKQLVYKGYKIMPYSTGCQTPLSNFEANGEDNYKDIDDPSIYVKFAVKNTEKTFLVAWTSTPWTLPSNLSLCVNSKLKYHKIQDQKTKEIYILMENTADKIYNLSKKQTEKPYKILEYFMGENLRDLEYEPIFDYFKLGRIFKIICDDFVESTSGTGIVHLAPSHGQEDFDTCILNNIVQIEEVGDFCPIDDIGCFTEQVADLKGIYFRDANEIIIKKLKDQNILLKKETYRHSYPFCWRTDTPLIYKAISSFFIRVTAIKEQMVENNKKTNWIPENIGKVRFHQWLENAKDWGVSRSRIFGTPIPVWLSEDGEEMVCIGSIDELMKLTGLKERPLDIHPEFINHLTIPSKMGKGLLKRTTDIFDCWFESGCVPYGQLHYPFENQNYFDDKEFLCDFICEALDQIRGWFYTLTVLSVALFNKPAFKNVICSGLILAKDGRKFAKKYGNFVPPLEIINRNSSDALRLYLTGSPAAHADSFKFNEEDIGNITKKFIQWLNGVKFFIEHTIKLEKDGYKLDLEAYKRSTNITDNWILTRLRSLVMTINNEIKLFQVYKIKDQIMDFIEDLTNWYIKFNRNRLKGRFCCKEEQTIALSTLIKVLNSFSKITAPFTPFLSETIYQKLNFGNKKMSIHLDNFPKIEEFPNDPIIERKMKRLQEISGIVRSLRSKSKASQSIKIPLKSVTLLTNDQEYLEDIVEFERYLKEEINALKVNYVNNNNNNIKYNVIINQKIFGSKFKSHSKKAKELIDKCDQQLILNFMNSDKNELKFDNFIFSKEDFLIKTEFIGKLEKEELFGLEKDILIIVDFEHNEEVIEHHIMRMFIYNVQKMRKNTKLRPWNKINIYFKSDNTKIVSIICDKFYKKICEELIYNVDELKKEMKLDNIIIENEFEICGYKINVVITDPIGDFIINK